MDRAPVSSSTIASVGYDELSKTLEIQFRSGAVYRYSDVPATTHRQFMDAPSKGRYFARNIRNIYDYTRV